MSVRFMDGDPCYRCEDLDEELSKLKSMIRAIEQIQTYLGIAGDFDEERWIRKSDLDKILRDP